MILSIPDLFPSFISPNLPYKSCFRYASCSDIMLDIERNPAFAAISQFCNSLETVDELDKDEIEDDIVGKKETLVEGVPIDKLQLIEDAVLQASKGVGDRTDSKYKWYCYTSKPLTTLTYHFEDL